MESDIFNIGIIFNAIVSTIVAGTAVSLIIFLYKRYDKLTMMMKSYSWFWFFTAIAWILISIKYLLIGFGYLGPWIHYDDILLQSAIFLSGLPLIYYVGLKFFDDKRLADILGIATIVPIAAAIWLIIQPGGLVLRDLTFFSAKSSLNSGSLTIFNVEVAIIIAILIYDIARWLYHWRQSRDQNALIESLFAVAIMTYLVLGSIEQSELIKNWTVIIFRIMYAAAFLFVYLLITHSEAVNENYLMEEGGMISEE